MKRIVLLIVTLTVGFAAAILAGRAESGSQPYMAASRDLTDAEVERIMDAVFGARIRTGLMWTDSLATECKGHPRYHLMRARLMRELIPVDDENKDEVKRQAKPLYKELETVISVCETRIKNGDPDPRLRLYKGWAWMLMSHMHTFEKSFWSAGKEAKKGKEDLDWYLARHPNDPVASSLMGAFLYFADTLPSAYKFVSKLFFLPSGDRDRGLQMMEAARGTPSAMETDNGLILYSVYLGFEGRYEEGLEGFEGLQRKFPHHATFVRPGAVMHPLLPGRGSAYGDSLDAAAVRVSGAPAGELDQATVTLIRFQRAFADRFFAPARAEVRFDAILKDAPEHPDWITGFASYELGAVAAVRGDASRARRCWELVLRDAQVKFLHEDTRAMLAALDKTAPQLAGPRNVSAIYGTDASARAEARKRLESLASPTVVDLFYLGEACLMSNDLESALHAYTGVINTKAAPWEETYQLLAATRAGEIFGSRRDYLTASKHYETAGKFWRKEFLLDWVLESRKRYYSRLAEGKETTLPTLLTRSQ